MFGCIDIQDSLDVQTSHTRLSKGWINSLASWNLLQAITWSNVDLSSVALALTGLQLLLTSLIAKFMGPTWGPHGSCRPQMDPMLAPWTFLSGMLKISVIKMHKKMPIQNDSHVFQGPIAMRQQCHHCSFGHWILMDNMASMAVLLVYYRHCNMESKNTPPWNEKSSYFFMHQTPFFYPTWEHEIFQKHVTIVNTYMVSLSPCLAWWP